MINAELLRDKGILVVSPIDKLEAADFEHLRLLADPYIERHGKLNGLMIEAESFPGWEDFSGMLAHIRFVRDFEKRVERVAAVADTGFLAILPQVADHFVSAQVRHFDHKDRNRALSWLRTGLEID